MVALATVVLVSDSPARAAGVDAQQAYVKASSTDAGDRFSRSVAISGDTMVVGAPSEDSSATGVDGDQADDSAADSGAVYVFTRSGGTWSQQAYLKASNAGSGDQFGWTVAISGDSVVVGAPEEDSSATGVDGNQADNSAASSGAGYAFIRSGGAWSQQAYLKASNTEGGDGFGSALSIGGDTMVVGAPEEDSSATGVDGDQADNVAFKSGAGYVFTRSGGTWSQQAYLKASTAATFLSFGYAVAVAGDTVVVGAPDESGIALNSGAGYVFVRSGGVWSQQAYLKASNPGNFDSFGAVLAISGDTVVVAAPQEDSSATGVDGDQADNSAIESGAAYVFVRSGGGWDQQAYLKASNPDVQDFFGASLAVSGNTVVAGAPNEDSNATGVDGDQTDNSASGSGAGYVFIGESTFSSGPTASISGSVVQGQTLTARKGTIDPVPDSISYQWHADAVDIGGATGKTLKLNGSLVGKKISVTVTAAKAGFEDASDTSDETAVVKAIFKPGPTASISGEARVGKVLTAHAGAPSPSPTSKKYAWFADGKQLAGQTAKTLTVTAGLLGKRITVKVTVDKAGFAAASDVSDPTIPVSSLPAKTISMELNDYTVARGQAVKAEIELLSSGEAWSIVLDGMKLASGTANTKGVAVTTFAIPANATLGTRVLHAYGLFNDRTDPDNIAIR